MLWTVAVVLFVLWALGFGVFPHVAGDTVHLLLVVLLGVVIYKVATGRRVV